LEGSNISMNTTMNIYPRNIEKVDNLDLEAVKSRQLITALLDQVRNFLFGIFMVQCSLRNPGIEILEALLSLVSHKNIKMRINLMSRLFH